MLLLPEPYGYSGFGAHVSFRVHRPFDPEEVTKALLQFSCYPLAIPKILSCLKYSGRYDCVLSAGWYTKQRREVHSVFAELGIEFIHNHYTREDLD